MLKMVSYQLNTLASFVSMTDSSEILLRAWYVSFFYWEEEEDGEGKQRLRKVSRNESIYSIMELLLEKWPQFRCRVRCRCRWRRCRCS